MNNLMQNRYKWAYCLIFVGILLFFGKEAEVQKRPLSLDAYFRWKNVEPLALSDDGKWVTCRIQYRERSVVSEDDRKPRVVVFNTETQASFELVDVYNAYFFADRNWMHYHVQLFANKTVARDSVIFMNLQTGEKKLWTKKYACTPVSGTNYVIWEEPRGKVKRLCLWDILTRDTLKIDSVKEYSLYDNKKSIIYIRNTGREQGLYAGKLDGKHRLIHGNKGI